MVKKIIVSIAFLCVSAIVFTSCKDEKKKEVKKEVVEEVKKEVKKEAMAAKYQCPMDCEKGKTYDKPGNCPVCKMALKKKEAMADVYQCPMDCEKGKTYDKAGKCPKCNMDLKKKAHDSHEGHKH